jgi:hypothetical protein
VNSERIKNWPTKERPRERLLAEGPERMTDADLLAIILRIGSGTFREGVPGKNAYEAALSILRDFRGLRGLDRSRINDLLKVPGLGPAKVRSNQGSIGYLFTVAAALVDLRRPDDRDCVADLLALYGVGRSKLEKYGDRFLEIIGGGIAGPATCRDQGGIRVGAFHHRLFGASG